MGAALAAGQGMDLIDDDSLHAAERIPRPRGQQQEQRLWRGDQDVRGLAGQLPALVGGGVPGAHADPDVRLGQAEPVRGVPDADERRAQISLDVDRQRLER